MRWSSVYRPRIPRILIATCVAATGGAAPVMAQAPSPPTESVFVRAQRMVTSGQDSAGRAVVDSVLQATAEGTPRYAEALFWRATFSKTAAAAERDYRRISVEYPLSPRAQESLLRLAQLEMTRGDRAKARVHFERIQREYPTGNTSVRASVALAPLPSDHRNAAPGCAAAATEMACLTAADLAFLNHIEDYSIRYANQGDPHAP